VKRLKYESRRVLLNQPITVWVPLDETIDSKEKLNAWLNGLGYGEVVLFEEGLTEFPNQTPPFLGCYLDGEGYQFKCS
jgi:hypothetical protein